MKGAISLKTVNDEIAVNALTTNLGKGESEVIILCKESGFDYALIDERTAREKAALMGVNTMGVLGEKCQDIGYPKVSRHRLL